MSPGFREGEGAAEGAVRIARKLIGRAAGGLESAPEGPGLDGAIHMARKRIKKARAALRLARRAIGKRRADKVIRRLGDAVRPLSESRDASVLLATFDALIGESPGAASPATISDGRRFLEGRLAEVARDAPAGGAVLAEVASSLRSLRRRIGRWDLGGDDARPASGLKRSFKRGRAALGAVREDPTPEAFHRLRKRVKDLGSQLQSLGVGPEGIASTLDELARALGDLHDLDVLRAALTGPALDAILPRIDRRRAEWEHLASRLALVTFSQKPGAFARRSRGAPRRPGPGPDQGLSPQ